MSEHLGSLTNFGVPKLSTGDAEYEPRRVHAASLPRKRSEANGGTVLAYFRERRRRRRRHACCRVHAVGRRKWAPLSFSRVFPPEAGGADHLTSFLAELSYGRRRNRCRRHHRVRSCLRWDQGWIKKTIPQDQSSAEILAALRRPSQLLLCSGARSRAPARRFRHCSRSHRRITCQGDRSFIATGDPRSAAIARSGL